MLCYSLDENNIEQARKAIGVLYDNIDASSRIFYCNNLKVNTMLNISLLVFQIILMCSVILIYQTILIWIWEIWA